MPHSPEVSGSLFPHRGDESEVLSQGQVQGHEEAAQGQEHGEPSAVVGDSGAAQSIAFAADAYVRSLGEDRIEVSRYDDHRGGVPLLGERVGSRG